MKQVQTTLKGFSIKPHKDNGDYEVAINFQSQEGPGMLEEIIAFLGPMIRREVILRIEPVQMRI